MNNLKVLENGLIPVYQGENGQVVDGRELHEFLESKRQFADWIKDRIQKYGFIDGDDYVSLSQKCEGNNATRIDYILKIDTAKEIAMVENNEKGSQARKYFIAVEKKFREISQPKLSKELQAIFLLDARTQNINDRLDKIENVMTIDYSQQEEIRTKVSQRVLYILGGKEVPAYKELNNKAFSQIWRDYKRVLSVNSYRNTAVKDYDKGFNFVNNWKPSRELELMIAGANSQIRM